MASATVKLSEFFFVHGSFDVECPIAECAQFTHKCARSTHWSLADLISASLFHRAVRKLDLLSNYIDFNRTNEAADCQMSHSEKDEVSERASRYIRESSQRRRPDQDDDVPASPRECPDLQRDRHEDRSFVVFTYEISRGHARCVVYGVSLK